MIPRMAPRVLEHPTHRPLPPRIKVSYPRRMTIAAGFICKDGVILCGDTELSTSVLKLQASKLFYGKCSAGRLGFACSGASVFATAAIQKCMKYMKNIPQVDFEAELEICLANEYNKSVLTHPDRLIKDLTYNLLVVVQFPQTKTKLFVTEETALQQVLSHKCIGIGSVLADYLSRWFNKQDSVWQTLSLAGYILANAKEHVDGCGGISQFLLFTNDGKLGRIDGKSPDPFNAVDRIAKDAERHDRLANRLLLAAIDPNTKQLDFQKLLEDFAVHTEKIRDKWGSGAV
jgi:hypothetical protein